MLDKSKQEAEDDRKAYAKYKCYVDQNVAEKSESVKKLGEQISLLESKIEEIQARNGEVSSQAAELERSMAENKATQESASAIREKSQKSFEAMEADLVRSIGQMKEAIDVLSSISLGQTKTKAFQDKFMGGKSLKGSLLNLGTQVRTALEAVSALLPANAKDRKTLRSFLQSPLSADHTAQGDAIVGILKNLKSTFEGNLENARSSQKAEKKAFESSLEILKRSHASMETSLNKKKQELGDNDGELAAKKTALNEAQKQKKDDEEFLAKLQDMAAEKSKEYDERKMLRMNEDLAISQAITILNNDAAFQTFGEVDATSTGKTSFLQVRHRLAEVAAREQAETILSAASSRLARLAAGLRAGNPFKTVLAEIEKMKKTIVAEAAADQENKVWCEKERSNSKNDLEAKNSEITNLKEAIDKVDESINDPKTGFKQMIKEKDAALLQNQEGQVEQTKTRNQENAAYQEDVRNLSDAEDILGKAIAVLTRYYDELDKRSKALVQVQHDKQDPSPPKTFDSFSGQSKSGGEAIKMLEFILSETKKEHATADKDEKTSQKDYDESMDQLKKDERDMQQGLVKLRADLADAEKELLGKQADLKDTTEAKEAVQNYLQKIKPGCDFIAANFDLREQNRETETKALNKAATLIKETPAYKAAAAKAK